MNVEWVLRVFFCRVRFFNFSCAKTQTAFCWIPILSKSSSFCSTIPNSQNFIHYCLWPSCHSNPLIFTLIILILIWLSSFTKQNQFGFDSLVSTFDLQQISRLHPVPVLRSLSLLRYFVFAAGYLIRQNNNSWACFLILVAFWFLIAFPTLKSSQVVSTESWTFSLLIIIPVSFVVFSHFRLYAFHAGLSDRLPAATFLLLLSASSSVVQRTRSATAVSLVTCAAASVSVHHVRRSVYQWKIEIKGVFFFLNSWRNWIFLHTVFSPSLGKLFHGSVFWIFF